MADKVTGPSIRAMKGSGKKIVSLTAYDFPSGAIADSAGVDIVLVGDSLGNVVLGLETTVPVSMEHMLHHTAAVRRGVSRALLVADMPFGSFQVGVDFAVRCAVDLAKAGAEAVKLEGDYVDEVATIVRAGIPVMGHVGLTPQSVHRFGGFRVQGRGDSGDLILEEAIKLEEAGAFAIVLELVPKDLAKRITGALKIPTIGIGAGPDCDGQVQVWHDVLGISETVFKHAKPFMQGREAFDTAIRQFASDVREGSFPGSGNSF